MKTVNKLAKQFMPEHYDLVPASGQVKIRGRKLGRPSKRLAFHQKGLKVSSAKIIYKNKNKIIEHEVVRINHLPTLNQVRLHTAQLHYPGEYEVDFVFSGTKIDDIKNLEGADLKNVVLMEYFPSIDELEAKESIKISID